MFFQRKVVVKESHCGALLEDGVLRKILTPGVHSLWSLPGSGKLREVVQVDLRERSLECPAQELLTADGFLLRAQFLAVYHVTDAEAALKKVDSYEKRAEQEVQVCAQERVLSTALDDLLKSPAEVGRSIRKALRDRTADYGVEVLRVRLRGLSVEGHVADRLRGVPRSKGLGFTAFAEAEEKAEARLAASKRERAILEGKLAAIRSVAAGLGASAGSRSSEGAEEAQKASEPGPAKCYVGQTTGFLKFRPGPDQAATPSSSTATPL